MNERPSQTVSNLRKSGQLDQAWDAGYAAIQENPNDAYLKGAFFWVCYEYLKQVQNPIAERGKQNNGNFRPYAQEQDRIAFLLDWVIWLNIPPGGYEYPNLLVLFQKNLEHFPQMVNIVLKYQEVLFADKDREPYQSEKGESPSLMLKCARHVAAAWMQNGKNWNIPLDDVLILLDKTRQLSRDTQQKIWLDYDEAKCLIMAGRHHEAREFVIPVLKRKQSESWAWGALAATYRSDDIDAAITLFANGLCHAHDDKFALPLLKGITPLLLAKQLTKEASMCVKKAANCYQANGWSIKADLQESLNSRWYESSVDVKQLDIFLKDVSEGAMDYLIGPTCHVVGLVVQLHDSGKGVNVFLSENETRPLPLRFFKGNKKPALGNYVKVFFPADTNNKEAVAAELTSAVDMPGVEPFSEELRVTDKGFGFAGNTYIPPNLIKSEMNGKRVEGMRYQQFDKKKGKPGWCAYSIKLSA